MAPGAHELGQRIHPGSGEPGEVIAERALRQSRHPCRPQVIIAAFIVPRTRAQRLNPRAFGANEIAAKLQTLARPATSAWS